jgi:hypothetical protein
VFCQLDVTARTETDRAADTLVRNLLRYTSRPAAPTPGRPVIYAGDPAGLDHLRAAGVPAAPYEGGALAADRILVVGPGGGARLAAQKPALTRWLADGGSLLAIGLDETELATFLPEPPHTRSAEHIATFFEPPAAGSLLAGVGPADVHNRDPRLLPLVSTNVDLAGDGVLATAPGARVVFCQLVPWQFEFAGKANVKRTYRRASFLVSRLLGNLGAASNTPILDRIATSVAETEPPRYKTGLYLDQPEEWDDPYRFFRW